MTTPPCCEINSRERRAHRPPPLALLPRMNMSWSRYTILLYCPSLWWNLTKQFVCILFTRSLTQTRLLCNRDGPSTSTTTTTSISSNVVCPHHSPRIDSDETQSSQLSESDSESQYIEKCCCQLADAPMQAALVGTIEQPQQQHQLAGPSASSAVEAATNAAVAAGVDPDVITLEASDTYPEEMFTAWHHGTVQGGEIEISNKCSKRLYKLMAAEGRGICKMSSECRCDECQSNYFDCDFDNVSHNG